MFCSKCGNQLTPGQNFCPKCGAKADGTPARHTKLWIIPVVILAFIAVIVIPVVMLNFKGGNNVSTTQSAEMVETDTIPQAEQDMQKPEAEVTPTTVEPEAEPEHSVEEDIKPETDNASDTDPFAGYVDSVDYDVNRIYRSLDNSDGTLGIEVYYDLVQLKDDGSQRLMINEQLKAKSDEFFNGIGSKENLSDFLDMPYQPYKCTTSVVDVTMYDGIVCIKTQFEWYMGGVYNTDFNGYTFNLNTGESCSITDFFGLDAEEVLYLLKGIIYDDMENGDYGYSELAHETVAGLALNDINYFVENDGEITLLFPTYMLGYGASGPLLLNTGLYIATHF